MMDKHGIKSLDKLSSEEKKRFFNAVDKSYKAKNEETLNENPAVIATAARMAIQNKQGNKVSVNTARQSSYSKKDPQAHKKAKSLFQKIKDKISKKEKKKSEPKKQSKSSAQKYADLYGGGAKVENVAPNHDGKAAPYGSGYEEMDEAKIQVQGIGMYDDKTLKKKIIQLASELQKNAKSGNWNKASENGIRALGRMWGAYQDYAMNNESVNENSKVYYADVDDMVDILSNWEKGEGGYTSGNPYMGKIGKAEPFYDSGAGMNVSGGIKDALKALTKRWKKLDVKPSTTAKIFKAYHKLPDNKKMVNDSSFWEKFLEKNGISVVAESVNEDVFAIVDKYNDKKQDYDQVYFKDNNLNKVKKHMKKMGSKYGKMNLIQVKPNGKMSLVEDTDIGHQDDEPNMLKSTALEIMEYGKKLYDKLDYYDDMENEVDFPNWWQSKLIISKEYLQKAYHYLDSEEKTDES